MSNAIPDKAFFKIGEAARVLGVPAYVLRYWETEFDVLRPEKSRTNQRVYKRQDIERLLEIKRLLYEERFTISGARRFLRGGAGVRHSGGDATRLRASQNRLEQTLLRARAEARQLLALLEADERSHVESETE